MLVRGGGPFLEDDETVVPSDGDERNSEPASRQLLGNEVLPFAPSPPVGVVGSGPRLGRTWHRAAGTFLVGVLIGMAVIGAFAAQYDGGEASRPSAGEPADLGISPGPTVSGPESRGSLTPGGPSTSQRPTSSLPTAASTPAAPGVPESAVVAPAPAPGAVPPSPPSSSSTSPSTSPSTSSSISPGAGASVVQPSPTTSAVSATLRPTSTTRPTSTSRPTPSAPVTSTVPPYAAGPTQPRSANEPPFVANPGQVFSELGEPVSYQFRASTLPGETLSFQATGLPDGLSIDPATGLVTGTPTRLQTTGVQVTATSSLSDGRSFSQGFTWSVRRF